MTKPVELIFEAGFCYNVRNQRQERADFMRKTLMWLIFVSLIFAGCANKMPVESELSGTGSEDSMSSEETSSGDNISSGDTSGIVLSSQDFVSSELPSSVATSSDNPVSSKVPSVPLPSTQPSSTLPSQSSSQPPSEPPSKTTGNNQLLEKHNLEIEVHAWNDYMPMVVASGETPPPFPRPHFIVRFTAISDNGVPDNISVFAKITSGESTTDFVLNCDGNSPQYNFETFRVGNGQSINMGTSERLTAEVAFVIGDEKQTLTFYPTVTASH